MMRLLPVLAVLVLAPSMAAAEPGHAELVRGFADEMIFHGTDRWGREHSTQFASMLLRSSPPELMPDAVLTGEPRGVNRMHVQNLPSIYEDSNRAHKITYRGGDVAADAGLCQLLCLISRDTGDSCHAEAADASPPWFLGNASLRSGLLPWDEHSGWVSAVTGLTTATPLTENTSSTPRGFSGTAS